MVIVLFRGARISGTQTIARIVVMLYLVFLLVIGHPAIKSLHISQLRTEFILVSIFKIIGSADIKILTIAEHVAVVAFTPHFSG